MARVRVPLTINPDVIELAKAVMAERKFDELSDFVSALFREEYDRRGKPPIVSSSSPPSQTIAESASGMIEEGLDEVRRRKPVIVSPNARKPGQGRADRASQVPQHAPPKSAPK